MERTDLRIYAAPMEGITTYVWRKVHHRYYPGIDKYYTPFVTLGKGKGWTAKEKSEVYPGHNEGMPVVPQILTNNAEDFVLMAGRLTDLGYHEVNLNLGCPSGTVVSKRKGSGFLKDPEAMRFFFEEIFSKKEALALDISVKTRLGMESEEEILPIMQVYDQFPLLELIIHARYREDMYKYPARQDAFEKALAACRHPVIYNGDIFHAKDADRLLERFPTVKGIMLGRGLIGNPQLAAMIREGGSKDILRLKAFHDELCEAYREVMSGDRNVLFKMKEIWNYLLMEFPGSEKTAKKVRKSVHLSDYKAIVEGWFYKIEEGSR